FFRPRVEGTLGLLPYAARDVLRNRRRSISSILGVLLAVTFVAGTFIAIDSSARATLDASLAGIPGDFSFSIYTFGPNQVNYSTLEQAVLELGGVVNVSVYRNLGTLAFELRNSSGSVLGSYYVSQTLAINPDRPPVLIRDADWLLAQLNESSTSGTSFNGEVWIDRTAYVNPYDTVLTTRNLERIQRRLQAVLGSQASSVSDNILPRIQDFSNRIAGQ